MLIGSRQKLKNLPISPTFEINGTQLSRVDVTKSLRDLIDENLTWSNHIDFKSKKISSGIGAIKRIKHFVPPATLHRVYEGLIQAHFDYCSIIWDNCGITLANKLQRLQNRAARVLTFSNYDADANQLFKILNWKISRISLLFPCHVQTILKTALVIVVQLYGTAYPLRLDRQAL